MFQLSLQVRTVMIITLIQQMAISTFYLLTTFVDHYNRRQRYFLGLRGLAMVMILFTQLLKYSWNILTSKNVIIS